MWNIIKSKLFSNHVGYITARVFSQEDGKWRFEWRWESSLMPISDLRGTDGPFDTEAEAVQARQSFMDRDLAENPNRQYNLLNE